MKYFFTDLDLWWIYSIIDAWQGSKYFFHTSDKDKFFSVQ